MCVHGFLPILHRLARNHVHTRFNKMWGRELKSDPERILEKIIAWFLSDSVIRTVRGCFRVETWIDPIFEPSKTSSAVPRASVEPQRKSLRAQKSDRPSSNARVIFDGVADRFWKKRASQYLLKSTIFEPRPARKRPSSHLH